MEENKFEVGGDLTIEQLKQGVDNSEEITKFNQSIAKLLSNMSDAAKEVSKGITNLLNDLPIEHKPKIDRCRGCIFKSEYRDMGASSPVCTIERFNLVEAVKLAEAQEPCEHKLTYDEARAYALSRSINNKSTPE